MGADELRIPTVAVSVQLSVSTWSEPGELFIAEDHKRVDPIDGLVEMLDGPMPFLPFRAGNRVRLVSKAAIISITVQPESPASDAELVLYDRQHRVEIHLVQGTRFEGLLLDNSPGDRPRVIDHLSSPALFVRLWTAKEHVLIAKSQISTVTELEER
jgi:hypothetical protein